MLRIDGVFLWSSMVRLLDHEVATTARMGRAAPHKEVTMTTQTTTVLNGLDTQQMVDTIESIKREPSLAKFQFRARNT